MASTRMRFLATNEGKQHLLSRELLALELV